MLLDVLRALHITGVLRSKQQAGVLVFASEATLLDTAWIIYNRTNGVPRFVANAVLFLRQHLKHGNNLTTEGIFY